MMRSDDPEVMSFLLMYGVSIALAAVMLLIFEADSRSINYSFEPISMKVGVIYVSTARLVAFAITVVSVRSTGRFPVLHPARKGIAGHHHESRGDSDRRRRYRQAFRAAGLASATPVA
ncbi:MAG: hypothetical protein R3E68_07580 [Burkholderiaceae bacterium]